MSQTVDRPDRPRAPDLPAADGFAAWLDERCAAGLQAARDAADRLKAGEATSADQALRIWDEGMIGMSNAAAVGSLFSDVHPDEAVRTRGRGRGRGRAEARHRAAPTARCTTCSPRSTRPGSTRTAARLLDKTLDGVPARGRRPATTRPARGWPRSTSG